MLQKWLCVRCYDEHRVYPWNDRRNVKKKERTWAAGHMWCVAIMDMTLEQKRRLKRQRLKIAEQPPECCYYLLEQTLNQPDS